jgi:hypothetical protein
MACEEESMPVTLPVRLAPLQADRTSVPAILVERKAERFMGDGWERNKAYRTAKCMDKRMKKRLRWSLNAPLIFSLYRHIECTFS